MLTLADIIWLLTGFTCQDFNSKYIHCLALQTRIWLGHDIKNYLRRFVKENSFNAKKVTFSFLWKIIWDKKKRNWKFVGHQNLGSFYSIIKGLEAFGIILDCGEKNFSKTKQVTATSSAIFGVKEFSDWQFSRFFNSFCYSTTLRH